jgi:calcium binding protein 39
MSHYARFCYIRISERWWHNSPSIAKFILANRFYTFPHYIETTTFGISCDAFANLKETLTRHKPMVAEYLDKNYDRVRPTLLLLFSISTDFCHFQFFSSFTTLILSNNYVTKRQSLKLLGEILLDRANFNVMTRYIANEANLKMMMNLLRDKSKNIQFEAFHVFKVRLQLTAYQLMMYVHCF